MIITKIIFTKIFYAVSWHFRYQARGKSGVMFHAKYFAYSIHHQLHGTVHGVTSHEHRSPSPNTGAQSSWDLISDVIPSSRAMQRLTRGFASYLATRNYIVTWKLYLFWRIAMELRIYFLRKLTFIENQTFLRNFSTTKIWSYTVFQAAFYNFPSVNFAQGIRDKQGRLLMCTYT